MVDLHSDVFNWVLFECLQVFRWSDEQWQRNVEEDGLDRWFDELSALFEFQADSQVFEGNCKGLGANELSLSGHYDVEEGLVEFRQVGFFELFAVRVNNLPVVLHCLIEGFRVIRSNFKILIVILESFTSK